MLVDPRLQVDALVAEDPLGTVRLMDLEANGLAAVDDKGDRWTYDDAAPSFRQMIDRRSSSPLSFGGHRSSGQPARSTWMCRPAAGRWRSVRSSMSGKSGSAGLAASGPSDGFGTDSRRSAAHRIST
jgi:hypothetical protein